MEQNIPEKDPQTYCGICLHDREDVDVLIPDADTGKSYLCLECAQINAMTGIKEELQKLRKEVNHLTAAIHEKE